MKFSREYESQADILGVQLMARAGYNPQSMANMFRTLASQGRRRTEWLSDHPNPGNREQRMIQEAKMLNATGNPYGNTAEFQRAQARLKGMSPALTAQQIEQQNQRRQPIGTTGRTVNVAPPSGSFRTYQPANGLRVAVPTNWEPVESAGSAVTYAPQGAYFQGDNGGSAFTHGVEVGVAQGTGNLQNDTNSLLRNFSQGNPNLQQSGRAQNDNVGGRNGITVQLANVSEGDWSAGVHLAVDDRTARRKPAVCHRRRSAHRSGHLRPDVPAGSPQYSDCRSVTRPVVREPEICRATRADRVAPASARPRQ
jgi:hypothetical protein